MLEKHPNRVIVDVAGVGYDVRCRCPRFYVSATPARRSRCAIHTHVREDQLALYGFATDARADDVRAADRGQRHRPEAGAGGAVGHRAARLVGAIQRSDLARLTRIPGVGKKTAERMCVELRDRLPKAIEASPASPADSLRDDLVSALANLGYHRQAIDKVARQAAAPQPRRRRDSKTCCGRR